ncbi:MAG: DNA ligase D [Terracidiphilus sp.]|jgi:bifunctional non-homologous end joining protein LigD
MMARKQSPRAAVDRQLARYRAMRDFGVTAEPRGRAASKAKSTLPFVIQKHQATRLHYDFRLGWNGVLKSWAVAKGPSYNPADKRLAVQVEDHPIEYGGFEGTIPKGQYGGGTVMVWDQGTWEPHGDADQGLRDGHLKFTLHGEKLRGDWVLVRMKDRTASAAKPNWLLIKERDDLAQTAQPAVTDALPNSVVTGRSLEQIASDDDHVWNSKESSQKNVKAKETTPRRQASKQEPAPSPSQTRLLRNLPRENFPGFIAPELALATSQPPDTDAWLHELKLDGYRIQIHVRDTRSHGKLVRSAALLTRNGLDWTHRMPEIAQAAARLPVKAALLDGEVVVLEPSGQTSFAALQAAFQQDLQESLIYFAFDLLHLDGRNLRNLPLTRRQALLAELLKNSNEDSTIRLSESFHVSGKEMFSKACQLHAEGIVSKLASSTYHSGRSGSWLKMKCSREQEFVIGGFTLPSKGGHGIGALLLGYYQNGKLIYAGRSGTGFTQKMQHTLRDRLDKLLKKHPPFTSLPADARRNAQWVKPKLVAQVAFATWTTDNLLRQAAFKGLREDKAAKEVAREEAARPAYASHAPARKVAAKVNRNPQSAPKSAAASSALKGFHLTHPDKQLDETSGLTKLALANYYLAVAHRLLPHIAGRPLSIVRCPEGSTKPCFFQKHIGSGLPNGVDSVPVRDRETGATEQYITVSSPEGLVGLAQMGVLEIHPWGSRNNSLEKPDRIIFDLDPDASITWKVLAESARSLRALLKKLGLQSFVKLTGGKGLHVVVPIRAEHSWPAVKAFAHGVATRMEQADSELFITKMTKSARAGKIYLDYLRNDRGSTAVAPYSPRARAGVPVSLPLAWKELDVPKMPVFAVADFAQWKARLRRDPWKEMSILHQALTKSALQAVGAKT